MRFFFFCPGMHIFETLFEKHPYVFLIKVYLWKGTRGEDGREEESERAWCRANTCPYPQSPQALDQKVGAGKSIARGSQGPDCWSSHLLAPGVCISSPASSSRAWTQALWCVDPIPLVFARSDINQAKFNWTLGSLYRSATNPDL